MGAGIMVNDAQKHKHDPTLALDILQKLAQSPLHSVLHKHYLTEANQLFSKLQQLERSSQPNNIKNLILVLQRFQNNCQNFKKLSATESKIISLYFTPTIDELESLQRNSERHRLRITCALDGYTLNRTTDLIEKLQAYIETQQNFKSKALETKSLDFNKTVTGFHSRQFPTKTKQELIAAKELQCLCEDLRKQIGSRETMPRGLIITFMLHLCQAFSFFEAIYTGHQDVKSELFDRIQSEINRIRQYYPELAERGEELQKAIANYQLQKS
jgi:hypothetical protein